MNLFKNKIFSTITSAIGTINPSTLNGAIDVIAVQQEDGTLRCTPFHVRFGKLGVLQSARHKVYITINDVSVDDLYMQLGDAGEAVFIEEVPTTPTNQPTTNLYIDTDNSTSLLSSDINSPSSNSNESSQTTVKQQNEVEPTMTFADEQEAKPTINIDVIHSNTFLSTRRRTKRRLFIRNDELRKQTSEDDDQDGFNQYSSLKRRSRVRKRDSIPIVTNINMESVACSNSNDKVRRSIKLLRKRSASENDIPLFQFDPELSPLNDPSNRSTSIENRPITLDFNEKNSSDESSNTQESNNNIEHEAVTKMSTNPIIIEQKVETTASVEEIKTIDNSLLSKSAPSDTVNTSNLRKTQSNDPVDGFYSNREYTSTSYENVLSPRPTSPKSDTEYELEKSSESSSSTVGWQWKWGELPEQRGVFRYLWPSSKKTPPKEGIYLDDITNNQSIDRSLYLPPLGYHQTQQRAPNDDDRESGTGNSIPQSPFREHEASCFLGDAQMSLCGNINKQSSITDEVFNAHLVTFEAFTNNPSIINDPNLVVRINGKYYNWAVASPLIVATSIFHKQLPHEIVDQLQEKHMAQTKPRTTGGGWWLPFYSKKSDMKTETPKVTTPVTTTDILAAAAKSETVPISIVTQETTDTTKISKNSSKSDNDSEQEDSEVRKLTAKMEQEKEQQQQTSQQQSMPAHTMTVKKTMILSSDQLKRLNLKFGQNKVQFSVTTAYQGTTTVESNIFLFDHMTKFVISDIDGTITKSDVLGHIIPLVGGDWSHDGIAEFFNAIQENGYQFIYLSARAIGQSQITRDYLKKVKQYDRELPVGPLLISPDTLMTALYREIIAKKPEDFKIECLKNISSLFPGQNPFYAGFGNRINDQWAYTAVGIPVTRIYTINPRGEVVREKVSQALLSSYRNLHEIVDLLFPPMDSFSASETYSVYTYWREEPNVDKYQADINAELEEILQRQKSAKSNTKNKGATTPVSSNQVKTTTSTTTVSKSGNEKQSTSAQANDTKSSKRT